MITLDESCWPLVTVNFVGANSVQDMDPYLARMDRYLQRGEPYLVILNTLGLTTAPSLEMRQRQIEWLRKHNVLLKQRCLGTAFVITSPFIRLGLNIMYQLQPPSTPYTIVGELKASHAWALSRFRAAGLPLPSLGGDKQATSGERAAW